VDFIYQAGIVDISDFDTSHATINVPNNVSVYDINVAVNIAHTWVGDLDIFLRSPGGEMVRLYRQNINISGDDFVATIFDDDTTQLLSQGEPPYTGGFRPYQALANFDGDPAQGQWTLLVYDGVAEDFGAIITWEMRLIFRTAGPLGAENPRSVPGQFSFAGNYPNPFNPSTTFEFALEQAALVDLSIFNILGEHVATVVHEHYSAGTQRVDFDGSQLSSGVFFAKLTTPEHSVTRKIVLLK
jgi:subtilisin-like proprotein convertase family protein